MNYFHQDELLNYISIFPHLQGMFIYESCVNHC